MQSLGATEKDGRPKIDGTSVNVYEMRNLCGHPQRTWDAQCERLAGDAISKLASAAVPRLFSQPNCCKSGGPLIITCTKEQRDLSVSVSTLLSVVTIVNYSQL